MSTCLLVSHHVAEHVQVLQEGDTDLKFFPDLFHYYKLPKMTILSNTRRGTGSVTFDDPHSLGGLNKYTVRFETCVQGPPLHEKSGIFLKF